MRRLAALLPSFAVIATSALSAQAQEWPTLELRIVNPSFEASVRTTDDLLRPNGWYVGGKGYRVMLDTTERHDGWNSLRSERVDSTPYNPLIGGPFGVATQGVDARPAAGRAVRLSGWIRTDGITSGYAGFWVRADAGTRMLGLDNMGATGPRGTTPWTRYTVQIPVDSSATQVAFGIVHPGNGTAWFDSLRLDVVGPPRPRVALPVVASLPVLPRPTEDMSRLLSDAEMAPVADSGAPPAVDDVTAAWVRSHAHPIRSLGARDFADLDFLRPLLKGKRVVQLGESGHGVREFNLAKVRLIQYLHESLGYDVIAFESSLFACDRMNRQVAVAIAEETMRGCIFGVWFTREVLALFDYIRETRSTPHPLILAGFDVQQSARADSERGPFLARVVSMLDTAYAARVRAMDDELRAAATIRSASDVIPADRRDRLVAFYDSLATWLGDHQRQLAATFPEDPVQPALARQAAISMTWFLKELGAAPGDRTVWRDHGMADNLDFLLDVLHPRQKVIVWAHNFHIQNRGFGGDSTGVVDRQRSMGTWVAERYRAELYTVGLYMYRGRAAANGGSPYQVTPAAPGSLEAILHRAPWKYSFVDLSRARREPGSAWMTRPLIAKEWGTSPVSIVPRAEYDGLLFIDTTWPPDYLFGRMR